MLGWKEKRLKQRCAQLTERVDLLSDRIVDLTSEKDELEDSNASLAADNKKLRQKRQMEDEMIAHKLKMREEQVVMDADKKIAAAEQKANKKAADSIAEVKDTYRDKLENQLEKRGDELKGMYSEILTRLPDVSMAITKDIKERKK